MGWVQVPGKGSQRAGILATLCSFLEGEAILYTVINPLGNKAWYKSMDHILNNVFPCKFPYLTGRTMLVVSDASKPPGGSQDTLTDIPTVK